MNPALTTEVVAPRQDAIEVLLTLSPGQYAEMGQDIATLRKALDLPNSASNTQVIVEAVRRQAATD
jgi:hypothetical protein